MPERLVRSTSRLTTLEDKRFAPWVEAPHIQDMHVLWLGVSVFPLCHQERVWLLEFLRRLSVRLTGDKRLREEIFLQFSIASGQLAETFNRYTMKAQVLPGLSRRPGERLQGKADVETVQSELENNKRFDFSKWTSDYVIWFQHKSPEQQRELFWGHGGMSLLFLPPDPGTLSPRLPFTPRFKAALPIFQHMDVDAMVAGAVALKDSFLPRSKQMFGAGLEQEMDMKSVAFVLPSLGSSHMVEATAEMRLQWFSFFDVYCRESVEENGILLAFKLDYAHAVQETLASMRQDNLTYSGTARTV